ncbi:MAG: sodium/solute symporter [Prevotellaceae bacterium]|jgi:SSS family solute:Na+ symporter|nr:sodium/solute symporter [Prevotellaceae bacterium]
MNASGFATLDYLIFVAYAALIIGLGLWLSRTKKGEEKTAKDYFLAGGTLTWWAIGASLIAANISAEHFIGMSGSGYRIGLAIAAYEWMAAITLILVAKYLLPIMLEKKIYTIPQLAKERYGKGVSFFFSFFWLLVYVFVNLTSVAWLGALAMNMILGVPVMYGVVGLLVFAGIYSIYGGLKAVAWTDVLQVIFLVGGGLITAFVALNAVGEGSVVAGFQKVVAFCRAGQTSHFHMIITQGTSLVENGNEFDIFKDIPGIAVIFGGVWLTNIGYWGFNQYIIQKGLAAKSQQEAKRGLIFAGYLKILIPIIVVVPGIAAYALFASPELKAAAEAYMGNTEIVGSITKADHAYSWLLANFAPVGIRGLAFAALVAAIVSSLASMLNSTSTIFTMDIYHTLINKDASQKQLVTVGRLTALVALVIAMFAAKPLLGGLDQAFLYIQEYTGFIYPGVVVVFGMGLLWKKATNRAALWTAIFTIPVGIALKIALPDLPFMLRMGYVCMVLIAIAVAFSLTDKAHLATEKDASGQNNALKKVGWGLAAVAIAGFTLGAIYSKPLAYIGFESIFLVTSLVAFLAVIMLTNAYSKTKDDKAYPLNTELFKTDKVFFVGAMGICIIVIALYAYFW